MRVLYVTHDDCLAHDPGTGHPERSARLVAARAGVEESGIEVSLLQSRPASRAQLETVHRPEVVERLVALDHEGGGVIDPDTTMSAASFRAATLAVGSTFAAIEAIDEHGGGRAFCAVRPPGHHATPTRSMGFCLLNAMAIAATALRDRGERVAIVDLDAHHGNGTQDAFVQDPRVLFASIHQWPFYPGTGSADQIGLGDGLGSTINVPVPAGATGDVYRLAVEQVFAPALVSFAPTWLLLSIGYDAHRDDPLTALGLSSGDYGQVLVDLLGAAPNANVVAVMEGGYDLDAVRRGVVATLGAFADSPTLPERCTSGGPGREMVERVAALHRKGAA